MPNLQPGHEIEINHYKTTKKIMKSNSHQIQCKKIKLKKNHLTNLKKNASKPKKPTKP